MNNSFYIYAFPRSGSHYLQALLRARLQSNTRKSHDMKDYDQDKILISVVRNPIDAITSDAAIGMYHKGYDPETVLPKVVNTLTRSYINTLREIYDKSSIIVDFEDLVSRPEEVAIAIAELIDVPVVSDGQEIKIEAQTVGRGSPDFFPSAKQVPIYETIINLMSTIEISDRAEEVYQAALSKAIKL